MNFIKNPNKTSKRKGGEVKILNNSNKYLRYISIISFVSSMLIVGSILSIFLGRYLDNIFGTYPIITLVSWLIFAILCFYSIWLKINNFKKKS